MARLGLLVALLLLAAGTATSGAQSADILVDGGFEAGGDGWAPPSGATLVVDGSAPVQAGAASGHLTAAGAGTFALSTQYWRVPTEPLAEHTLRVWIYANDLALSEASVTLEFVDASGAAVGLPGTVQLAGQAAEWRLATIGPVVAPAGTAFARVVVRGTAAASGATLHVDSATLERGAAPSPTPTETPTATATVTATATATATSTATSTATATSTGTATPTKTATPRPGPFVFDVLVNGGFEFPDGLFGWRARGGTPLVIGGLPDAAQAALLLSETSSTKWLYQTVRVEPGRWYLAGARLRPQPGVSTSWVRTAWYASDDGSGSQLSTDDSDEVPGPQPLLVAVEAGPIQAPSQARSVQVRLMLRPAGSSLASLIVDDVFFVEVDAPTPTPSPTPTPTESATATATASETPSPIVAAGALASPEPAATARAGGRPSENDGGVAREAAPEILLRITELLPNPIAPGPDADFEWIEVTNVGTVPLPLAGLVLEDNAASVALPELVLPPGGSLVVAGVSADIGEALAIRLPGGLFNGLGNEGDRVALLTADGRRIDALSYGNDATYDQPPLGAPGPGESIERRFAKDGTLTAIAISSRTSPGRTDVPTAIAELEATAPAAETPAATAAAGGPAEALREPLEDPGNANRAVWIALILLALAGLAGAGAFRVRELRR